MNNNPSLKSDYCFLNYNNLPTELASPTVDFEAPKDGFKKIDFKRRFVFVIDISIPAYEIDFSNYVRIFNN